MMQNKPLGTEASCHSQLTLISRAFVHVPRQHSHKVSYVLRKCWKCLSSTCIRKRLRAIIIVGFRLWIQDQSHAIFNYYNYNTVGQAPFAELTTINGQ